MAVLLLLHHHFNALSCITTFAAGTLLPLVHRRHAQNQHLLATPNPKFNSLPRYGSLQMGSQIFTSPMALGSDTSVDTDDMYDDLFKKYGKVVFTRSDQKSAVQEIDDDAESLSFAVAAAKVASEVKAAEIRVLFVKPLVYWTRFFIIATAFSRPQIDAIGTKIRDMAEKQFGKVAAGDSKPNSWTLLDFGDVCGAYISTSATSFLQFGRVLWECNTH